MIHKKIIFALLPVLFFSSATVAFACESHANTIDEQIQQLQVLFTQLQRQFSQLYAEPNPSPDPSDTESSEITEPTEVSELTETSEPEDCSPTASDMEGPYYRSSSQINANLIPTDSYSEPLVIKGIVKDTSCKPIPHATIDIWQADEHGEYQTASFRGKVMSDTYGAYTFKTLMPGAYTDEEGNTRPQHVHLKLSAPGYRSLTTQLYLADGYSETDPRRTISPEWDDSNTMTGKFTIYLQK